MSSGYTGKILSIDLTSGKIEKQDYKDEFYRMYLGGSSIGSYFLLKETGPETLPLSKENIITKGEE